MVSVLFFADISEKRINAQDLNAQFIVRNLSDNIEITILNSHDSIRPEFKKGNIRVVNKKGISGYFRVLLEKCLGHHNYHFYVRTYESKWYWFLKKILRNKSKTIHIVENMLPYPASERYNKRAAYNATHCDYVFSISSTTQQQAQEQYGLENVYRQKVGVDTASIRKKNEYIGLKRILSVGSLQKRKRPLTFAQYAKDYPELEFHWYGDGPERNACEAFIQQNNLNNLHFFRPLPHSEILEKYCEYDLFVFPSIHEGFGKVTMESMAAGVVPIIFNHYKPDMVTNKVDGFVVESDSEVNEIIDTLKQRPQLLEEMGKCAKKKSLEYDWATISSKWECFFKENA